MRTAQICPTCATYTNALCVIYDGPYLSNINVSPMDDLESALGSINDNLIPITGVTAPTINATYVGQLYVNSANGDIYYAVDTGTGASDWVFLASSVTGYSGTVTVDAQTLTFANGILISVV